MKTHISTLRKIANRLGFSVYPKGGQWILSDREEEQLHPLVTSERAALLVGLTRAASRDMLTKNEMRQVENCGTL